LATAATRRRQRARASWALAPVITLWIAAPPLLAQERQEFDADPPGVLVLAVDAVNAPYVRLITERIMKVVFAARRPPTLYFETLDVANFRGDAYFDNLRAWYRAKYESRRVDLVVTLGNDALRFLARGDVKPWPSARILFADLYSIRPEVAPRLPMLSGIVLEEHFPAAIDLVLELLPGTRSVLLATGGSPVERGRNGNAVALLKRARPELDVRLWEAGAIEEMPAAVAALPKDSVLFFNGPILDSRNRQLVPLQVCQMFSAASSVPVFSLNGPDFGCGIVGGRLRDHMLIGQVIGEAILAELERPTGTDVAVPYGRFTSLDFDARQLARWKISEDRLPAGSRVHFRSPNLWRDQRDLVIGTLSVTGLQALLIGIFFVERRRRRVAEVKARRHLTEMAHLDRRAALGELAASLAHELNQPLNAILQNAGTAEMILARSAGGPETDELRDILTDIKKDNTRAAEVIRGLRAMLQKREPETAPLDLSALVRDTTALVRHDAGSRDVAVSEMLADGLPVVLGERVQLQQVVLNLLLNAIEAVSAQPTDRRMVQVVTRRAGDHVVVEVADTGPGVPPEGLPQIFEAFYTTKTSGMGMGLSISRSIVDAHGGRMHARNNDGHGATVGFTLPIPAGS
jgi:signal transduction histidine kinase